MRAGPGPAPASRPTTLTRPGTGSCRSTVSPRRMSVRARYAAISASPGPPGSRLGLIELIRTRSASVLTVKSRSMANLIGLTVTCGLEAHLHGVDGGASLCSRLREDHAVAHIGATRRDEHPVLHAESANGEELER